MFQRFRHSKNGPGQVQPGTAAAADDELWEGADPWKRFPPSSAICKMVIFLVFYMLL